MLAVGLDRFTAAIDEDLDRVAAGGSVFKAIRGEYGAGKTFFTRWLAERAKRRGFATAEVQISETETPLHRMETVYRRLVEHLTTEQFQPSALRPVLDGWIFALEEDVLGRRQRHRGRRRRRSTRRSANCWSGGWPTSPAARPAFAAALRGYRRPPRAGDHARPPTALAAWLGGQPHVAAVGPPRTPASRATSTTSARSASCRAC